MQNAEQPPVWMDTERCTGCGECLRACGRHLITLEDGLARVSQPMRCAQCGHCKAVCPVDAPQLPNLDAREFTAAPRPDLYPQPDELLAFLRVRRSIRAYRAQPVERDKLEMLVQAGRYASTGQNRHALGYVVLSGPEAMARVRALTVEALLEQADRLESALAQERAGGPPLGESDQAWRDYPPAFRLLAELVGQGQDPIFHHAPAVVAVHVYPHEAMHPQVEAGMAAMQMALMAVSLGLGTCFCGLLDFAAEHSPALRQALGLPPGHVVPISFMLGSPDLDYPRLTARRPAKGNWL